MKHIKFIKTRFSIQVFYIFFIVFFTSHAQSEINNKLSDTQDGGFLEINSGVVALQSRYIDAPKDIGLFTDLRFSYYWRNFFLENKGIKGLGVAGMGYNFYNQNAWMFDVFVTETHPAILWNESDYIENGLIDEQDGLLGIKPRDTDDRTSLRATYFIDDTSSLRFIIAPISEVSGINSFSPYVAAWYGNTWQYKNMNFHTILNAEYFDTNTLDYYYGIRPDDVTDKFTLYQATKGISISAEVGLTYPLSSDWVLESSVKFTRLPTSMYKSPLVHTRLEAYAQLSVTYVLF